MAKRNKKPKSQQQQQVDRISELPDYIIILILSFLDTRDSVRTTTLSRRWQRLWIHVPNLTFSFPSVNMMFVERTLALHTAPKVFKFSIKGNFSHLSRRSLHLIIHFLMNRHVEDLNLQGMDHKVILPKCIFYLDSLRELRMQACNLSPRMMVSWTSLSILDVQIADLGGIDKILLGCPVLLESLILCIVSVFMSGGPIHIVHNNLKKLVLHYTCCRRSSNSEEMALNLVAPRFQKIDIFPPC